MILIDTMSLGNQVMVNTITYEVLSHLFFKKSFWFFWCKKKGHKKIDCHAFKTWLDNKNKSGGVQKPTKTKLEGKQAQGRK